MVSLVQMNDPSVDSVLLAHRVIEMEQCDALIPGHCEHLALGWLFAQSKGSRKKEMRRGSSDKR